MPVATSYPDVFFTPEYQELFRETAFGGEPCHFEYAGIDYRFYKRPIAGTPYFDIVSPYGYSGHCYRDEMFGDWTKFLYQFAKYCKARNIIAEFARFHSFEFAIPVYFITESYYERDIFYIDLTKSEAEIFKSFDKGCRSAIKQAEKKLNIHHAEAGNIAMFSLYRSRMTTLGASDYQFNGTFFDKLSKLPGATAILAHNGDEYVAGAVILIHGDYAHYFLSGSIPAANYGNATNLIIWEAVKLAKARGCKIFNLGGGLKTGDGLESFKRSFTKLSQPFYTYRRIHNPEVYAELSKGIETDYFPAYRAERRK